MVKGAIAMADFEEKVLELLGESNQRQKDFQEEVYRRFDEVNQRQKDFQDEVNQRFDEVYQRFDGIQQQFDEVNQRQNSMYAEMRQGFAEAKEERETIREMVVKNTESITSIQGTLDEIKDDQKSIQELLGEHEIAIRTLRRKPV